MLRNLREDLKKISSPKRAKILARFFKTGKGEYGEGDIFLGITVPNSRKIAIKYRDLPFDEIRELLKSKIHEERLISLLILVHNFQKGEQKEKKKIFEYYMQNTKYINNWDLVDLSADKIVGEYLISVDRSEQSSRFSILSELACSNNLWERRIAMVATFAFIKRGECVMTFKIAGILLSDRNDLIQKAVGWMLREAGKRCGEEREEQFLVCHYKQMGRTALREKDIY